MAMNNMIPPEGLNDSLYEFSSGRRQLRFDGKRMRNAVVRKTIDFNSSVVHQIHSRTWQRDYRDIPRLHQTIDYVKDILPSNSYLDNPSNAFCTKYVSSSMNKVRSPITALSWTPEGRRLITGTHSGEFTLWNGLTFNFETILQAHEDAIRSMVWSKNNEFMISSDASGIIKYWQPTMNNVKAFQAHNDPIRDVCFSPTDAKFATASDDSTIKIWDFLHCKTDTTLEGHGWDVHTVAWHPHMALLVSGSKDNLIKVWDPKSCKCLRTLHGHKNTVSRIRMSLDGNYFVSASRDQLLRLWDLRMMKQLRLFRGHKREVTSVEWHPYHPNLFVSGSFEGTILYWLTNEDNSVAEICGAHDAAVWGLSWHPLGHMLASGSNDNSTRFWTRNRPGEDMQDKYNANQLPRFEREEALIALAEISRQNPGRVPQILKQFDIPLEDNTLTSTLNLTLNDSNNSQIPGLNSK